MGFNKSWLERLTSEPKALGAAAAVCVLGAAAWLAYRSTSTPDESSGTGQNISWDQAAGRLDAPSRAPGSSLLGTAQPQKTAAGGPLGPFGVLGESRDPAGRPRRSPEAEAAEAQTKSQLKDSPDVLGGKGVGEALRKAAAEGVKTTGDAPQIAQRGLDAGGFQNPGEIAGAPGGGAQGSASVAAPGARSAASPFLGAAPQAAKAAADMKGVSSQNLPAGTGTRLSVPKLSAAAPDAPQARTGKVGANWKTGAGFTPAAEDGPGSGAQGAAVGKGGAGGGGGGTGGGQTDGRLDGPVTKDPITIADTGTGCAACTPGCPCGDDGKKTKVDPIATFVTSLYDTVLGREPEKAGFDYWTGNYSDGKLGCAEMVGGFLYSAEAKNRQDNMSTPELVNYMYPAAFGRKADAEGAAYWTDQLNTGKVTRDEFVGTFANHGEVSTRCRDAKLAGLAQ